jgi:hypothetical protein
MHLAGGDSDSHSDGLSGCLSVCLSVWLAAGALFSFFFFSFFFSFFLSVRFFPSRRSIAAAGEQQSAVDQPARSEEGRAGRPTASISHRRVRVQTCAGVDAP